MKYLYFFNVSHADTILQVISYLLNKSGPPGLSSVVLFKTVKVLVEQFESFSSEGDTIGVSSLMRAPNGSFSVTGVRTGLFNGDSTLRVSLHKKYYIYISLYMQISIVKCSTHTQHTD